MTSADEDNGVMHPSILLLPKKNHFLVRAAVPDCVGARGFHCTGVILSCGKLVEEKRLMKLLSSLQNRSSLLSPGFSF